MQDIRELERGWLSAVGAGMTAIRNVTDGHPTVEQIAMIHRLADALHNIGTITPDNRMFTTLHSQERLDEVVQQIDVLDQSRHERHRRRTPMGLFRRDNA